MLPRALNVNTAGNRTAINRPLVFAHEISTLCADKMGQKRRLDTGSPRVSGNRTPFLASHPRRDQPGVAFRITPTERNEQ